MTSYSGNIKAELIEFLDERDTTILEMTRVSEKLEESKGAIETEFLVLKTEHEDLVIQRDQLLQEKLDWARHTEGMSGELDPLLLEEAAKAKAEVVEAKEEIAAVMQTGRTHRHVKIAEWLLISTGKFVDPDSILSAEVADTSVVYTLENTPGRFGIGTVGEKGSGILEPPIIHTHLFRMRSDGKIRCECGREGKRGARE